MARKSIPDFKTEEEELAFWDTHRIQDYDDGPADDIIWDIRPRRKKRLTMRVDPDLVGEFKKVADDNDMGYQTLARGLVTRGVRELQEAWWSNEEAQASP